MKCCIQNQFQQAAALPPTLAGRSDGCLPGNFCDFSNRDGAVSGAPLAGGGESSPPSGPAPQISEQPPTVA